MTKPPLRLELLCVGILCATLVACGGEVVGIGNSGNRIGTSTLAEEVALAFAQSPATPEVTDAMVAKMATSAIEVPRAVPVSVSNSVAGRAGPRVHPAS